MNLIKMNQDVDDNGEHSRMIDKWKNGDFPHTSCWQGR